MRGKMKINELMLDNWVRCNDKLAQITFVRDSNIVMIGVHYQDGTFDMFNIKDMSPVIITPEILEANGFVQEDDEKYILEDGDITLIYWMTEGYPIRINKGEEQYNMPWCGYIHTFQNYLHLAGIEKEIIL